MIKQPESEPAFRVGGLRRLFGETGHGFAWFGVRTREVFTSIDAILSKWFAPFTDLFLMPFRDEDLRPSRRSTLAEYAIDDAATADVWPHLVAVIEDVGVVAARATPSPSSLALRSPR